MPDIKTDYNIACLMQRNMDEKRKTYERRGIESLEIDLMSDVQIHEATYLLPRQPVNVI